MEEKSPILGLPEKAVDHFNNRLETIMNTPKKRRGPVWWATLFQMRDELEEMVRQGRLSKGEEEKVRDDVGKFMSKEDNLEGFDEVKEYFKKQGLDEDLAPWWKVPEDTP